MAEPMSDLVILLPGIGGSVLVRRDAQGRDATLWSPRPGAALRAVLTLGGSIRSLALDGDDPALDDLGDGIRATALLPDLHVLPGLGWKIDGYGVLRRRLAERFELEAGANYLEFPYDWRRDIRVAARQLARAATTQLRSWRERSGNPDARLILIGHSMGGLVARVFLEQHEGWKLTRRLVSFGTPYSGSINAIEFLVNGFRPGWGPLSFDLSGLLRSFTSVYQLLPSYRCMESAGDWLALDAAGPLPNVDAARLADALALHRGLRDAVQSADAAAGGPLQRYDIRPLVGDTQRTKWGARLDGDRVVARHDRAGQDGGDGTVPRLSAMPPELLDGWRNAAFFCEQHASLQNDAPVFEHLAGVLRAVPLAGPPVFPAGENPLALEVDDTTTDEPLRVRARPRDPVGAVEVVLERVVDGRREPHRLAAGADGWHEAEFAGLAPGDYRVRAGGGALRSVTAIASVVDLREAEQAALP